MNSPRIAYICADPGVPVFGRKGCSIHVQEVVRALLLRGAKVSLFASRFDGAPPRDLSEVTTHPLPCPRDFESAVREHRCQQANQELRRLLYAHGPFDFVYERYSLWSYSGMSYARTNHVPGLLEVNAPLIEEQAEHRGLVDRAGAEQVATRAFTDATALIAVSDEVGNYLRQRGAGSNAVHVIPNGVNPERFQWPRVAAGILPAVEPGILPGGKKLAQGEAQENYYAINDATIFPGGKMPPSTSGKDARRYNFTVGFVGTLKPWHGVAVLIDAFALLHREFPNTRLLLVGDGPERANLETRVCELGLTSATQFTGAVAAEEIPGQLATMDVAVAPYPQLEKFYFSPLKAYEYMAAGCATVASRIGQLDGLIEHECNGLLCKPGDANDLAAQLTRLCSDVKLCRKLGDAGRNTILKSHTWDHVAAQVLQLGNQPARAERGSVTRSASLPPECCGLQSRAPLMINSNKSAMPYEVR